MLMNGGGEPCGDGGSPPPPAPSCAPGPGSGVIVQVGPGSHSSTNSATSTPTSFLTSPVTTPPTPAPSASSTFQSIFGGVNPLTFPAFSSNVTLTSNHVRMGSQDAAFVPNSPSTNITLPVVVPSNHHSHSAGIAPLAILSSSPSLGSSPTTTSPLFSPSSSPLQSTTTSPTGIGNGIVSIDVATTPGASSSSTLLLPSSSTSSSSTTLPSSSSCVISNASSSSGAGALTTSTSSYPVNLQSSSHMTSNAISAGTCSLNQSIAAGGIIGIAQQEHVPPPAPQHCLLVSCNPPSSSNIISSEAQPDNNNENLNHNISTSSTISIAPPPPPPSRSREHRKRERRERRRDRSYRTSNSNSNNNTSQGHSNSRSGSGGGSVQGHSHSAAPSSSSSYHHHNSNHGMSGSSSGTTGRHHHNHHHHHRHHHRNNGLNSSSFNSGNASSSSGVVQHQSNPNNSSSGKNNHIGSSSANNTICATQSHPGGDELIPSEVQSERGEIIDRLSVISPPPPTESGASLSLPPPPGMPDLLDTHHLPPAPPPYSTLPHPPPPPPPPMAMGTGPVPIPLIPSPVPVPILAAPPPPTLISPANCIPAQPVRYHFSTAARASRRSMRAHRGVPYASEEEPKTCCGMSASQAVSIRWFIIVIAVIGICCTLAGTALGAARSAGKEHLTLSLLMIGVGVLLLTVSAVAWRLTANESGTSCRAMLGFARSGSSRGDGGAEPNRRFVPRLPPTYGRPHHPYAAMMYPEFQYRPPPPSYQASMQEYRLRLLLLERSNPTIAALGQQAMGHGQVTMLPPPPYRPYSANMRMLPHARVVEDYSRPPSYRSRSSGNNTGEYGPDGSPGSRPSLDPSVGHNHHHSHQLNHHHIIESPMHSRDPSLLSYLSQQSVDNMSVVSGHVTNHHGNPATTTATVVTVVQAVSVGMDIGLGTPYDADDDGKGLPSLEAVDDKSCYDPEDRDNKDGNLVRIVQTTDSSQVIGRESVIVTVSGGGGSNGTLWDTYHHHHHPAAITYATSGTSNNNNNVILSNSSGSSNNNNNNNSNVITTTTPITSSTSTDRDQSGSGDGSTNIGGEVQILAHL